MGTIASDPPFLQSGTPAPSPWWRAKTIFDVQEHASQQLHRMYTEQRPLVRKLPGADPVTFRKEREGRRGAFSPTLRRDATLGSRSPTQTGDCFHRRIGPNRNLRACRGGGNDAYQPINRRHTADEDAQPALLNGPFFELPTREVLSRPLRLCSTFRLSSLSHDG